MDCTLQLLNGTGAFNEIGLKDFVRRVKLEKYGVSFKVVGIMGAQSSGKSTLLNALFDTSFRVMDASTGRRQTTEGVWLTKAEKLTPCTLVMDLEGSDGAERGEDGTLFEKQIALFALAVTDILLFNIWYTDIGRENAAGRPLLRIILDVMRRMFKARKITLMFVIRDISRQASIEILESDLLNDLQKIWDEASASGKRERSPVREVFDVIVTSLPNREHQEDEFAEQVTKLRMRFENPMEQGGLAADYRRTEPGTLFSHSTKVHWRSIQENKALDIPGHRSLVSAYRCSEILEQKLTDLQSDMMSVSKEGDANSAIEGFGKVVDAKVTKYLDEFRAESEYMDEGCRKTKLNDLRCEVSRVVWPYYICQIKLHQGQALSEFKINFQQRIQSGGRMKEFLHNAREEAKDSFGRGCEDAKVAHLQWTPSQGNEIEELGEELSKDIGTYVKERQEEIVAELTSSSKERLEDSVSNHTSALLNEAGKSKSTSEIWSEICSVLKSQVESEKKKLVNEIGMDFDLTDEEMLNLSTSLALHGRRTVEKMVKSKKDRAVELMRTRFMEKFSRDQNDAARQWSATTDILAIAYAAKSSALGVLSVLSATRLDEEVAGNNNVSIDVDSLSTLVLRPVPLMERAKRIFIESETPEAQRDEALAELSSKYQWRNVNESDTLITPLEFKDTWSAFEIQILGDIDIANEEKRKSTNNWYKGVAVGGVVGAPLFAVVAVFSFIGL